jgi:hypothetical protein
MDNPVQVQRSTGLGNHHNRNCVVVQQKKVIPVVTVLNCYAVQLEAAYDNPVLHFVCTGLSTLKSYGLKIMNKLFTLTFILNGLLFTDGV